MINEPPPLPSQLDYGQLHGLAGHLLRHAFNKGQHAFAAAFEDEDITPLRFMILELVSHNPGISHQEICAAMDTAASVITTSVKPLIAKDFLKSDKDPNDGRRLRYYTSGQSKTWLAQQAGLIKASEDMLLSNLTETERRQFVALLRRVIGM